MKPYEGQYLDMGSLPADPVCIRGHKTPEWELSDDMVEFLLSNNDDTDDDDYPCEGLMTQDELKAYYDETRVKLDALDKSLKESLRQCDALERDIKASPAPDKEQLKRLEDLRETLAKRQRDAWTMQGMLDQIGKWL